MPAPDIDLLILDVDGVLTDGRLTFMGNDSPAKTFYVQDGHAIKIWQKLRKKAAILSGRDEPSVKRRAVELGIQSVMTGATDKTAAYENLLREHGCEDHRVAYIGDDYPDLGPMQRCGYPIAVANAVHVAKRAADYVTRRPGGHGAVAEAIELLLRAQGVWKPQDLTRA